jgi:hypothetical protein
MSEVSRLLAAARMAAESPGHTLNTTALVHEAYLRLVGPADDGRWDGRGHLFAAAAEALLAATKAGRDVKAAGIADFYRAMNLFRQGKKDEAREVVTGAATRMEKPARSSPGPPPGWSRCPRTSRTRCSTAAFPTT